MKWTPGSLRVATDNGGLVKVRNQDDLAVATFWLDTDIADATLFTAAPELLESIKEFIEDPRFQVAVGGNPNAVQQMYDRAKSAIRKAEGKE